MALSYSLARPLHPGSGRQKRRRVLVTGAGGKIGSYFAEQCGGRYKLRLMLREGDEEQQLAAYGEIVHGDLSDEARMKELCT
ncbi:MAG TPA: hypothetical protein VG095_10730, partial [Chthoniobacterales bacterium]|nr:hypothetical protein [Chthoniobacterales bacterium]